jgi:hypothetical protein
MDAEGPANQSAVTRLLVSPYYNEAKNEITRPDRQVVSSRYFVENWMPRLGDTATCIVLYLRSLAGDLRAGEVSLEVDQKAIATAVGCSIRTLQRVFADNAFLGQFVRKEERFERDAVGHVRQTESLYFVALDDPLLPEDEPRLEEILGRRLVEKSGGKRIVDAPGLVRQNDAQENVVRQNDVQHRDSVVRQNDALREPALCDILSQRIRYDKMSHYVSESESIESRNVSESRQKAEKRETGKSLTDLKERAHRLAKKHGTNDNSTDNRALSPASVMPPEPQALTENSIPLTQDTAWRAETEALARHSAETLDDISSLGFHIKVWNHARKNDRSRGGEEVLTQGVFAILRALDQRRRETSQPQGKAWTRRVRKWFDDQGQPMLTKEEQVEAEDLHASWTGPPAL